MHNGQIDLLSLLVGYAVGVLIICALIYLRHRLLLHRMHQQWQREDERNMAQFDAMAEALLASCKQRYEEEA